jgi:hypothetical protein
MGKKKHRKSLTSKGSHSTVRRSLVRDTNAERSVLDKRYHIIAAWRASKNPWLTIENPDKSATNRRFIRVRAETYFGSPRPPVDSGFKSTSEV